MLQLQTIQYVLLCTSLECPATGSSRTPCTKVKDVIYSALPPTLMKYCWNMYYMFYMSMVFQIRIAISLFSTV